jgi:hypothetical protein
MNDWQWIKHNYPVVWCFMHMCMVGLVSSRGIPMMKPSELWASSEYLLHHFRRMYCDHSHEHDTIEGGESGPSQIWTWRFARCLADGIDDLVRALTHFLERQRRSSQRIAFPAAGRPELSRAVPADEVDPSHPRFKWSCRACRNGIERHDPRHTRDPDGCRWPLDESIAYDCEGCKKRLGRASPLHSYEPGHCRLADPELRGRNRQRQGDVHEPRTPASSAPGAGLRDTPKLDEEHPQVPLQIQRQMSPTQTQMHHSPLMDAGDHLTELETLRHKLM